MFAVDTFSVIQQHVLPSFTTQPFLKNLSNITEWIKKLKLIFSFMTYAVYKYMTIHIHSRLDLGVNSTEQKVHKGAHGTISAVLLHG